MFHRIVVGIRSTGVCLELWESDCQALCISLRASTNARRRCYRLCLEVAPNIGRRVQSAGYIETAVAEHHSYMNGVLRPGLESSSPEQVTEWFAGKVPFDFRLPAAESAPEKNLAYRLTGATLMNFKGSPAALVMYEGQNDRISLLVDSSKAATIAGGMRSALAS